MSLFRHICAYSYICIYIYTYYTYIYTFAYEYVRRLIHLLPKKRFYFHRLLVDPTTSASGSLTRLFSSMYFCTVRSFLYRTVNILYITGSSRIVRQYTSSRSVTCARARARAPLFAFPYLLQGGSRESYLLP